MILPGSFFLPAQSFLQMHRLCRPKNLRLIVVEAQPVRRTEGESRSHEKQVWQSSSVLKINYCIEFYKFVLLK